MLAPINILGSKLIGNDEVRLLHAGIFADKYFNPRLERSTAALNPLTPAPDHKYSYIALLFMKERIRNYVQIINGQW